MSDEIIQLCTPAGVPSGTAPRGVCHNDSSMIQMVVHLIIFNKKGEIFLQKRSLNKEAWPGRWDTAVGGHVSGGEDLLTALKREAIEEIGIKLEKIDYLFKQLFKSDTETEMSFVYKTVYDGPFRIDNNEVVDGRFFTKEEIREKLGRNIFTPNFEKEFLSLFGETKTSA